MIPRPSSPETTPVIVSGVRTPFIKAWTDFDRVSAVELGKWAVRELLYRAELSPDEVDEVILGCIAQPSNAPNIARIIALEAGLPESVPALTVVRNCASGMEALTSACEMIMSGRAQVVISGGVESMSGIPFEFHPRTQRKFMTLAKARSAKNKIASLLRFRFKDFAPRIALLNGLTDPVSGLNMGDTAEVLAKELHITRDEQDELALLSHQRVTEAWSKGRFDDEVMTVYPLPELEPVGRDNGVREKQSMEALARLRPVFDRKFGSVTAGNSSQITDGAVALMVMSEARAKSHGLRPLGYVRGFAYAGCEPERMGLGPAFACEKLFSQMETRLRDMELIEINEAFAAQVIANERVFNSDILAKKYGLRGKLGEIDRSILNVKGGAIALGHPVGASGARLVLTLLLEMKRKRLHQGLATLCVGGGQGAAVWVERR